MPFDDLLPQPEPPEKPLSAPLREWGTPWRWRDVAGASNNRIDFSPSRAVERAYERQLTSVAAQIEKIIRSGKAPEAIETDLDRYGQILEPWARQSAANMVMGVRRKNDQAWKSLGKRMGRDMREMLGAPGIGEAVRRRIAENVTLIQSLAWEERDKVARLIESNLAAGARAEDIARQIEEMSNASPARARTIARTEVSKAAAALTLARAESVGSTGYIWRTARDGDTRPSHAAMEGQFVRWDNPPTLDGMKGHAGEFPNCRCYPEPVIPQETGGKKTGVYRPALPTAAEERLAEEQTLLSHWERQSSNQVIHHVPDASLVNVGKARFEIKKLTAYSLNPDHPTGRAKAVAFREMLGITRDQADLVEKQVMAWLPHLAARPKQVNEYGERFNVYVPVTGPNGRTVDVMTAWIYDRAKDGKSISTTPRLINCFIDDHIDATGQYNGK